MGDDALGLEACGDEGAAATEEEVNGAAAADLLTGAAEADGVANAGAVTADVATTTTDGLGDECGRGDAGGLDAGVELGGEAEVTGAGVADDITTEVDGSGGGVGDTTTTTDGLKDEARGVEALGADLPVGADGGDITGGAVSGAGGAKGDEVAIDISGKAATTTDGLEDDTGGVVALGGSSEGPVEGDGAGAEGAGASAAEGGVTADGVDGAATTTDGLDDKSSGIVASGGERRTGVADNADGTTVVVTGAEGHAEGGVPGDGAEASATTTDGLNEHDR